jgi:hypothetical protein
VGRNLSFSTEDSRGDRLSSIDFEWWNIIRGATTDERAGIAGKDDKTFFIAILCTSIPGSPYRSNRRQWHPL